MVAILFSRTVGYNRLYRFTYFLKYLIYLFLHKDRIKEIVFYSFINWFPQIML